MIILSKAKCNKCGGNATADTYEQARKLINHAVGLSRGIKCGDNYNAVQEIKSEGVVTVKKPETLKQKKETETPIIESTTESKTEPKSDTKEKKTTRKSKN